MKGFIIAILIAAVASPAKASFLRGQTPSLLARVTVYWASGGKGSDRYTRRHKTSTGLRLRAGHCAVDPNKIPYGSNIILPDGTRLAAVDTGTAVRNRKAARLSGKTPVERNAVVIDRFFETKDQALAWANSHPHFQPVRVITPASAASIAAASFPTRRAVAVTTTGPQKLAGGMQLPKIR
jgi:3D (Asp-Asp-Asp) domain-containing protein